MNWDAIGAVGENIGAIAVVVSLIYLAAQTRANATALRANALWNAETAFGQINHTHGHDPVMAVLLGRAFSRDAKAEDFSEAELAQLHFVVRGAMQHLQAQWYLWKEGGLPEDFWDRRRHWTRGFIDIPLIRSFWDEEVAQHVIARDFQEAVESEGARSEVRIGVSG